MPARTISSFSDVRPDHVVGVIGCRSYPRLDAVRDRIVLLPPWNPIVVGDGGAVALTAFAAARSTRLRRRRLPTSHPSTEGCPAWRMRNRRVVAEADVLLIFADKPRIELWDAIGIGAKAGVGAVIHGPDGEVWKPPLRPTDPRSTPFYIDANCPDCGTALVPFTDDRDAGPVRYDLWRCTAEKCRTRGLFPDAAMFDAPPLWGTPSSVAPYTSLSAMLVEFETSQVRTAEVEAQVRRCLERGDATGARTGIAELFSVDAEVAAWHDLAADVARLMGDTAAEVTARRAALDVMLNRVGQMTAESFHRVRDRIRELVKQEVNETAVIAARAQTPRVRR